MIQPEVYTTYPGDALPALKLKGEAKMKKFFLATALLFSVAPAYAEPVVSIVCDVKSEVGLLRTCWLASNFARRLCDPTGWRQDYELQWSQHNRYGPQGNC